MGANVATPVPLQIAPVRMIQLAKARVAENQEIDKQSKQVLASISSKANRTLFGILPSLLLGLGAKVISRFWKKRFLARLGTIGLSIGLIWTGIEVLDYFLRLNNNLNSHETRMSHALPSRMQFRLHPQDIRLRNQYPRNTQIFTSQVQDFMDWGSRNLIQMADEELDQCDSLREACLRIQNRSSIRAWGRFPQQPLLSTNTVQGWKQSETKPRRVLIILGADLNGPLESWQKNRAVEEINELLKKRFGVAANQIVVLKQPTEAQIESELSKMQTFAQNNTNAETMVMLAGHGHVRGTENGLRVGGEVYQGGERGRMTLREAPSNIQKQYEQLWKQYEKGTISQVQLNTLIALDKQIDSNYYLREEWLKGKLNQYLSGVSSNFLLVYSCYSGAWSA